MYDQIVYVLEKYMSTSEAVRFNKLYGHQDWYYNSLYSCIDTHELVFNTYMNDSGKSIYLPFMFAGNTLRIK